MANLYKNPGEMGKDDNGKQKSQNGIDDDGNGFIDDYFGWDFGAGDTVLTEDNSPLPGHSHGTHCAGIVTATHDNVTGIAGVGINIKYLPVKIGYDHPWSTSVINSYKGVVYAGIAGADVISCSWGGGGYSQAEQDIIDAVTEGGALVVAASGNDGQNGKFFPASYDNVISVAASDSEDKPAYFTNYGYTVDIIAPGRNILSTVTGQSYDSWNGTSMATPIVSACAAMMRLANPDKSPQYIGELLKAGTDNIDTNLPTRYINKIGTGRVNLYKSLTNENPRTLIVKNIRVQDRDGDNHYMSGDTLDLYYDIENLFGAFQDLKLRPKDETDPEVGFDFFNPIMTIQDVPSDSLIENLGPVTFVVPELPAYDVTAEISLNFFNAEENFTYSTGHMIFLNPSYLTLDRNDIAVTFGSNGRMAYNDFPKNMQGDGFVDTRGNQVLFEGAFMIALDTNMVSDNARRGGGQVASADFFPREVIKRHDIPDTTFARTIFSDSSYLGTLDPYPGFHVSREVIQIQTESDYYDFLNSTVFITDDAVNFSDFTDSFHAGYYFDWDLGAESVNDKCVFDYDRNYGIVYDTEEENVDFIGVVMLSDLPLNFYAIDNNGTTEDNIGVYDAYTDVEKFLTLSSGIARDTSNVIDVSMVIGGGPATVRSGDTLRMTFAIFTAESKEQLDINCDKIRAFASSIDVEGGKKENIIEAVFPNPINSGESVTMLYNLETDTEATIEIFDNAGRKVAEYPQGFLFAGKHVVSVPIPELSVGAYFIGVRAGEKEIFEKLIIKQ
jgi:hypothetical protein